MIRFPRFRATKDSVRSQTHAVLFEGQTFHELEGMLLVNNFVFYFSLEEAKRLNKEFAKCIKIAESRTLSYESGHCKKERRHEDGD